MVQTNDDVVALLSASVTTFQRWVESQRSMFQKGAVSAFLRDQTWSTAVDFVSAADPLIHTYVSILNRALPDKTEAAEELLHGALSRVCISGWMGAARSAEAGVAIGLACELRRWLCDLRVSGNVTVELPILAIYPEHARANVIIGPDAVTYVSSAALDRRVSERREKSYALKLELIRTRLGLSRPELARLIGVSREGLRQWERGAPISPDRWPIIDKSFEAVRGLLAFIKPEALPSVVRRPLKALNNASPLAWLMAQRHDELRKFYEKLFSYASTD
jgi:DNA-binding XRE family transcriptional regulator